MLFSECFHITFAIFSHCNHDIFTSQMTKRRAPRLRKRTKATMAPINISALSSCVCSTIWTIKMRSMLAWTMFMRTMLIKITPMLMRTMLNRMMLAWTMLMLMLMLIGTMLRPNKQSLEWVLYAASASKLQKVIGD